MKRKYKHRRTRVKALYTFTKHTFNTHREGKNEPFNIPCCNLFLCMFHTSNNKNHWRFALSAKCSKHFMWHEITYQMTIIQRKWTLNALHSFYDCVGGCCARDVCGQLSTSVCNFDGLIYLTGWQSWFAKLRTKPIFIALKDCALHHFPIPNWQLFARSLVLHNLTTLIHAVLSCSWELPLVCSVSGGLLVAIYLFGFF